MSPRTRLYRNGRLDAEGFPIAEVSDHLADPSAMVWFDLCHPTPQDLAVISEELGLHALAVEDVLHDRQRPKLDVYDHHLFLTVYALRLADRGRMDSTEINIFLTRQALVTVRDNDRFDIGEVVKRWDANADMTKQGVGFLLHGLLDYVVDGHFELIHELDDQIEDLEDELFDYSPGRPDVQRRSFELRKTLVQFRRLTLSMREVVNTLIRRELNVVEPAMAPYYQDVYDHVLRVAEMTDSLRDLLGNIRETHMTQQGYRLNTITKQVTGWAAIIAVPTAITGFFGQNVPYPGSEQPIGFWVSTILIVGASTGLYWAFRKWDWL